MKLFFRRGLILLVCLLLLAVIGCGDSGVADEAVEDQAGYIAGEEEDALVEDDLDEEVSENGEEVLALDEWEAPANLQEMIAKFEEIQHSIIQDGEVVATIHYLYEGSETIEGTEADRVSVDFGEEKFIVWVDPAGELIKIQAGGEEIPAEMASMFVEPMMANILMPFQIARDWNARELVADYSTKEGVNVSKVQSEQQEIGGRSAQVHTFEVTVEPPAVEADQGGTMRWQIADFGDLQIIIGWDVLESSGEEMNIEFKIEKIVLR
ncbi:MAG: hypothetical protein SVV67_00795 [Bacillota bacterium]|nr:hypothetical protein [Bacillota bacterium]